MNQLSYTYSGAVTDTNVSSIIHRVAYGNDEIRFVTNIKSESECNSSTTDTTTGTDSDTYCTLDATLKPGSLDNQTVNSGSPISDIVYDIITDCTRVIHLVSSSGLPSGVSASIVNYDLKISGTPTLNSSRSSRGSSTTYNYSVVIDNHLEQTSSAPFVSATVSKVVTGSINVINSSTSSSTISPITIYSGNSGESVCIGSPITPVVYQLASDVTSVDVSGLPSGVTATYDNNNRATISGTPNSTNSPTTYTYTVNSIGGSQAQSITGSITLNSPSNIILTSQANTSSQTVSSDSQINDIIYQYGGGATSINVSGLPNGVNATINPNNQVVLSGQPIMSDNSANNEIYNFTISTIGNQNGCSESSISGSITILNSSTSSSTTSSNTAASETYTINVTASNASNYTLSGSDRNGNVTGNDPSVTLNVGDTIDFVVDASGHPFYLKTVQGTGTSNLISGVTNNGATNGTVSWTPTASGTYYYQCSLHNGMNGTITVN